MDSERLLGAEVFIPGGEHITHLLAWSIQQRLMLSDVLEIRVLSPNSRGRLAHGSRATNNLLNKAKPDALSRGRDQLPVRRLD